MEEKKKAQFTIMKKEEKHGGFGVGAISLKNMAPVFIDIEANEAYIDLGAMHARSDLERGIKFTAERMDGKSYWLVWVSVDQKQEGSYYAGVTACEMIVNKETKQGYKSLPEHVNRMDKSLKRYIIVEHMDVTSKKILAKFLQTHNQEMWEHSTQKLKDDLFFDE